MFAIVLATLSLLGSALLLVCTPWGIGLSPDSAMYIGGARGLIAGRGYTMPVENNEYRPVATYTPAYSAFIAAVSLFGPAPLRAARYAQAILMAVNIALAGTVIYIVGARRAVGPALFGAMLMLAAPDMLRIHSYAWSEALFVLLVMATAATLAWHIARPRILTLLACGVLLGLIFLTRYMGLAYVIAASGSILLFARVSWLRRLRDILVLGAVSGLPVIGWAIRNRMLGRDAAARPIMWHPATREHFLFGVQSLGKWFVPEEGRTLPAGVWAVVAAALAAAFYLWLSRRQRTGSQSPSDSGGLPCRPIVPLMMAFWIIVYLLSVIAGISFVDYTTQMNHRILSPALACAIIDACVLFTSLSSRWRTVLVAFGVALMVQYAFASAAYVNHARDMGIGYAAKMWRESATLRAVHRLPRDKIIYTNAWDVIDLFDLRPSRSLPASINGVTGRVNPDYALAMKSIGADVASRGAVIVLFRKLNGRPQMPNEQMLAAAMPLTRVRTLSDGVILGAPVP